MSMFFIPAGKSPGCRPVVFPLLAMALLSGICGHAEFAQAQDRTWNNPAGGVFGIAANWNPAFVPGPNDNAIFNPLLPYTIQFGQNHTTDRLFVRNGLVMFNLSGRTYTLDHAGGNAAVVVGQFAGNIAELRLQNGTLTGPSAALGAAAGSQGTVRVGAGANWNVSQTLLVGELGIGNLFVESGGKLNTFGSLLGDKPGSMGNATVTGAGSVWNSSDILFVGFDGDGTLNVLNGGVVNGLIGILGTGPDSEGTAVVSGTGSQWNNQDIIVGQNGAGSLTVSSGGVVNSNYGVLSDGLGSSAEVLVTGAGSRWTNTQALTIGALNYGTLEISHGGLIESDRASVGKDAQSIGEFRINGSGSRAVIANELKIGDQGVGYLGITNGGVVESGTGRVGVSAPEGTGEAFISGTGSQWNNSGSLIIGQSGYGTMSIQNGQVTNTEGFIGLNPGGTGTVTVNGPGSFWSNDGSLMIGEAATGNLTISSGGVVTSHFGGLGLQSGSSGVVAVNGFGSQWNISQDLTIGQFGNGTLTVSSGGRVDNASGKVGRFSGSSGTASVSGGTSQWNNTTDLEIGLNGQGTVNITSGGKVTVGGTTKIGSNGIVNISGSASRFEFGQTTLPEFARINATGGSLAGNISHSGFTHAASLTTLRNPLANLSEVYVRNSGVLYGDAVLDAGLINEASGEIEVLAGERMRFGGLQNVNGGEINNFGGQVRFQGSLQNEASGFIAGRGQFIADGGWDNAGVMAFSGGFSDVLGDLTNQSGAVIVTSGAGTTTFHDDVINQGEIRTSLAVSNSVFLGAMTGAGNFTGAGTVFLEGDLRPGNSPAIVSFGGDLVFGSLATTTIELGGLNPGEFDQLLVAEDLFLNDSGLNVTLWDGFQLGANMQFLIADVGGDLFGNYSGLGEGALVANFSGRDLFITYNGFGGQSGIGLFTAVPEPGSGLLLVALSAGILLSRRRTSRKGQR